MVIFFIPISPYNISFHGEIVILGNNSTIDFSGPDKKKKRGMQNHLIKIEMCMEGFVTHKSDPN